MKLIRTLCLAFSMYSRIPMPILEYTQEDMRYTFLAFPLVGVVIATLEYGWFLICGRTGIGTSLYAALAAAIPVCITGGFHMDGYLDTTDALSSHREREKKLEILKDSHVGSFAVIGLCLLVIAQVALFASVPAGQSSRILLFIPAVSRCGSALAVTVLKPMSTSQYAGQKKPKSHVAVLIAMTVLLTAAGFLLCGRYGFALTGCLAGYVLALRRAYRSLDGMSGDVAGYALTIGELCAVAVYALI